MKKYLLSLVAVMFSVLGFAQTTVYSMDTANEGCQGSNNGYAASCDVEIDGVTWNVTGNATMAPWRIGGKNLEGVDRAVYTKTAVPGTVNQVVLSLGMNTLSSINSVKLYVADNADFTSATEYVGTLPEAYPGTITYDITAAKNAFYKFVLNVSAGSSNKYVQFNGVEMFGEAAAVTVAKPVFSPAAGTYYGAAYVYATCETEGATIKYTLNNGEWAEWPAGYDAEHPAGVLISETSTLKAKAVLNGEESLETVAEYVIGKEYANLAELVNVEPAGQPVRVTLYNVAVDSIYVTKSGNRNGIYVNSGNEAHPMVEVYCYNVPESWEVGGTVSGTIEGAWKNYNGTWEVCPANWDGLAYTAPAAYATVNVDNANRVKIQNTNYEVLTVVDGTQNLSAGEYLVGPTGDFMLAEVKLNNEVLTPKYGTSYYVELAAGDVLDVTANWLDEDGEQAVSYISVNDLQAIKSITFAGVDCTEQAAPGGFDEDDNVTSYVYGAPKGEKVIITLNEGYETTSTLAFYAVEDFYEITTEKLTNLVIAEGGVVGSIKSFTIKARNAGEPIMSSSSEDVTLVNKATREVVYTWAADELDNYATDIDMETYFMPTAYVLTLDEEITAAGTYALVVPAGAFYVGEDMVDSDAATTEVTIEGTAQSGLYLESYELGAKGGSLLFSEDIAFANQSYMVYVNVSNVTTKAIATQATLTYDSELWNKVVVKFADELEPGTYSLDIPANTLIGNDTGNEYAGDNIQFTVEGESASVEIVASGSEVKVTPDSYSSGYWTIDVNTNDYYIYLTPDLQSTDPVGTWTMNDLYVEPDYGICLYSYADYKYLDITDVNITVAKVGDDYTVTGTIVASGVTYVLNCTTGTATGIANVNANQTNGKYLENGKIVIVRNGVKYNVNGSVIK